MHTKAAETETIYIQNILYNNGFPLHLIPKLTCKPNKESPTTDPKDSTKPKYATLTFFGKETKVIANIFKNTNVKIAYRTTNTLQKLLSSNPNNKKDKFHNSGIYRLTCPDCKRTYTGQRGRNFKKRYREHLLSYKHGNFNSKFAQHLIENNHSFGDMYDIMTPLCYNKKAYT